MTIRIIVLIFALVGLHGCASFNDSMTPSMKVQKDDFDGSLIVSQSPVSAASSMKEAWHTLGFEWVQKFPDVVFIEVGVSGITNVVSVAFNVDGEIIENVKQASSLTKYGDWSTRRLVIPIKDFSKIAAGKDVKMKVMQIDTYSVSSFGSANSGAIVNSKFPPFIEKLKELNAWPSK